MTKNLPAFRYFSVYLHNIDNCKILRTKDTLHEPDTRKVPKDSEAEIFHRDPITKNRPSAVEDRESVCCRAPIRDAS